MKAMHAALCSDPGTFSFKIATPSQGTKGYVSNYTRYTGSTGGYVTHRIKVALDHYHYVMVSKRKDLLVNVDDGAIWRHLRSDRFTTPILREWVPYVLKQIEEGYNYRGLTHLTGWGHNAGIFSLTTDALDEIVSYGLRNGLLKIPSRSNHAS